MTLDQTPDLPALPYSSFGPKLEDLLDFVANRVARDKSTTIGHVAGADILVESVARVAANSFRTAKFICSEDDAVGKRPEYVLSLPPLTRSLVDSIFLVVYIFNDVEKNIPRYIRGGWRELVEELARYKTEYGNDPKWHAWIQEFERGIGHFAAEANVTEIEMQDPKKVHYWPTPTQMLGDKTLPRETVEFLNFVIDWHYRSLSSSIHLSWPGLVKRSAALMDYQRDKALRNWRLDKQRSDAMGVTCVLALAFVTEIEFQLRFGLYERITYVWGVLAPYYGIAEELWDRRYKRLCDQLPRG